jgi:hypothetical protein
LKRIAFISHSSKDRAVGETMCRFLEANGIPCWIAPRDVVPGKNYGVAIVDAIDECGVFVLILSRESNKSGQVVREVERAASGNAVIIPVRVEPVQPSRDLEFYVSSSHWLDATEQPLEKHLDALVAAIRNWQNKNEPRELSAVPTVSPTRSSDRGSRLPLLIGGAVVAIAVIGFAIFLANKSSHSTQRSTSTEASPTSQSTAPRMGRRRAAREASSAEPVAVNSPIPAGNVSETPASNEKIAPGPAPVIERVTASSKRPPAMNLGALRHFEPMQAVDGDIHTAWIPNGGGPGESIEIFFRAPTAIASVSIFGGSGADAARYSMNNRVQEIRMTFPNGVSRILKLEDKMEMQRFPLPHRPVLQSIKFEIVSVYRGSKNDATPIAEIEFNRPD